MDEARKNQHNIKLEQQNKLNEMTAKQQHENNVVEQLKIIVADKETKVKVLENEIQQLKLAVSGWLNIVYKFMSILLFISLITK